MAAILSSLGGLLIGLNSLFPAKRRHNLCCTSDILNQKLVCSNLKYTDFLIKKWDWNKALKFPCHCNYHKFPLIRSVKSSWLPVKIAAYLVSIGLLPLLGISLQNDDVFSIKYPWTGRLLSQLSRLLQNFLTTLHISPGLIQLCKEYQEGSKNGRLT